MGLRSVGTGLVVVSLGIASVVGSQAPPAKPSSPAPPSAAQPAVGRSGTVGNVYAGRDGNVYKKTDGGWQQHGSGGWSNVDRPTPYGGSLDRDYSSRMSGSQRYQNYQSSSRAMNRSWGGGGFRGGGRRR